MYILEAAAAYRPLLMHDTDAIYQGKATSADVLMRRFPFTPFPRSMALLLGLIFLVT